MGGGGCFMPVLKHLCRRLYIAYASSLGTSCIEATFLPVMYTSLLFTFYCSLLGATSSNIVFTVL